MGSLDSDSERIARDWLCASQGDPVTAPLRYAARVLLEEAEAAVDRLQTIINAHRELLDWYENDHERSCRTDEELPGDLLELEEALKAAEAGEE